MIIKQKGTALISALLIIAIATLLATATLLSLRLLIHQTQLNINSDQMYEYLMGAEDWAKMILLSNNNIKKVQSLDITIGNIHIMGKIYAQAGLFNLNSLVETKNIPSFSRLLQVVVPQMTPAKAQTLAQAVNTWINEESNDDLYLQLQPPYRAGHRLMMAVSELRTVLGMTADIYQKLEPYVSPLPTVKNLIDINYAPLPVLFTLNDKMTLAEAQALQRCRDKQEYFISPAVFFKACLKTPNMNLGNITTEENFYLLRAIAMQGHQKLMLTSFLERYRDFNNKQHIRIVWQQLL